MTAPLDGETLRLRREIEELKADRARWVARCLENGRTLGRIRRLRERAAGPIAPMPVIVGAPRSGTTLLRFMLDAHPLLAIPPETGFLMQAAAISPGGFAARDSLFRLVTAFPPEAPTWDDFGLRRDEFLAELESIEPFERADGFRAFYRLYASSQNKPRYGDKTPLYCEHLDTIRAVLPEARFLHIIRDGRDTALSLRPMWFAPGQDIASLAASWKRHVTRARLAGWGDEDYLEVRFERLVTDTEAVLREVCEFVELPFDAAMLRYFERAPQRLEQHVARHSASGELLVSHEQRIEQHRLTVRPPAPERIYRWKDEMSAEEQVEFQEVAGELLGELGYELRA
jgi:hypothetical protein